MPRPDYYVYQANALDKAGWFSRLAFLWMWRFFVRSYGRQLGVHNLCLPPNSSLSEPLSDRLQSQWDRQLKTPQPSLVWALFRMFGAHYAWLGLLALLMVLEILCMQWLCEDLALVAQQPLLRRRVYRNAAGICAFQLLSVLLNHHYFFRTFKMGMDVRVACSGLMYRKCLRLHQSALARTGAAHVLSLLADEANRFDQAFAHLHFLLLAPLQIVVVLAILWPLFGVASAAAVVLLFLYIPFQALLGSAFSALRVSTAQHTDSRVAKTLEFFQAMRVLKMYAWEQPFAQLVNAARQREVQMIRQSALLKGLNLGIYFISSKLVVYLMLVIFVLGGGRLNASHVFAGLCLVNQLRTCVTLYFPYAISGGSEGLVALRRVQQFLLLPEQDEPLAVTSDPELDSLEVDDFEESGPLPTEKMNSSNQQPGDEPSDAENSIQDDEPNDPQDSDSVDDEPEDTGKPGNQPEREDLKDIHSEPPKPKEEPEEPEVVAERFSASWCGPANCLTQLSFRARGAQLVAVVGAVGAGKTSLLLSILNELRCTGGRLRVAGQLSYAAQEAWLFAGTLRENITFGKPFNLPRYKRVVSVCGLKRDLEQLPHGDRTYVGERAHQLSGGQRARVCLARAIYHEADVYLLDDPLSAVDGAVAKHIFDRCVRRHLSDKLVFLVTHQLQFLKAADQILLLKEGRLVCAGDYSTLLSQSGEFFRFQAPATPAPVAPAGLPSFEAPLAPSAVDEPDGDQLSLGGEQSMPGTPQLGRIGRRVSMRRQSSRLSDVMPYCMENSYEDEDPAEQHYEREQTAHEACRWWAGKRPVAGHWIYLCSGAQSNWLLCFVIVGCVGAQLLYTGSDYWLCCWAELQSSNRTVDCALGWLLTDRPNDNLLIYALLILAVCALSLWRTLAFFVWCMRTSVHLHRRLFASLSRCPLAFFEQSPLALLLNRCSRDMAIIDDMLPATIYDAIGILCMNVACVLLICLLQHRMVFASAAMFALFAVLLRLYLPSARQVRHLEAATRSPLYTHICASLAGLVTIRALRVQPTFRTLFYARQDCHSAAWFAFLASSRWFGVQLDWLCSLFIGAVALSSAMQLEAPQAGLVALAITSAINLTADFQWGMRQLAEASSQFGAVQRVDQFSHLPDEQPPRIAMDTDEHWPSDGEIEFVRVSLEYSPLVDTPDDGGSSTVNPPGSLGPVHSVCPVSSQCSRGRSQTSAQGQYIAAAGSVRLGAPKPTAAPTVSPAAALKCISFRIEAGEKIGIVGRTGAGKSSITAALFRLAEPSGSIFIDHVDTRLVPLRRLRESISIIPQEPLLFRDTLRLNLDPFAQYDDQRLWQALERVQLRQLVADLPQALDTPLHEAGNSFSLGQKQLICLARAILRGNKILVLDEATANVDPRTDALIQQTIRSEFASCTVLTIAHRLNTVMDSDRILVLDGGRVVEFDVPAVLLRNEQGLFSLMVAATGRETSKKLRLIANQKFIQG